MSDFRKWVMLAEMMSPAESDLHNTLAEAARQIDEYRSLLQIADRDHLLMQSDIDQGDRTVRSVEWAIEQAREGEIGLDYLTDRSAQQLESLETLLASIRTVDRIKKPMAATHRRFLRKLMNVLHKMNHMVFSVGADQQAMQEIGTKLQAANAHLRNGHTWRAMFTAIAAYRLYKIRQKHRGSKPSKRA